MENSDTSLYIPLNWERTVMGTLGIKLIECNKERVTAKMTIDERHLQPYGLLHGGVSGVIAETVASVGSSQFLDRERQRIAGLELNMNHIRSASLGETLYGVGIPLHIGRKTMVWNIKIHNEQDKLICASRCTIAVIDKPSTDK